MNKIKNALYGAASAAMVLAPAIASAQVGIGQDNAGKSGLSSTSITTLAQQLMNWLFGILGFLAVIGFVISGILYLTAAGDEDQIDRAKKAMMYSIIGIIVAMLGLIIFAAVRNFFGGSRVDF
ncbi:MAG: pilin [Candidatus Moraniibacteriota bacterium]